MTPKTRGIIISLMVGGAIVGGLGHQFYLGQINQYVGISPVLLIMQAGISSCKHESHYPEYDTHTVSDNTIPYGLTVSLL